MTALLIASLGFVALHALPSLPLRGAAIERLGTGPYLGVYSLAAGGLLVWMIAAYYEVSPGVPLYVADTGWRHAKTALMLPVFVMVVMGVAAPNPSAAMAGGLLAKSTKPTGILTITRHPVNVGIALWAGLHLISRPELPALIFFGAFLLVGVAGTALQERRKGKELGAGWRDWRARTSAVPFAAILAGRARFAFSKRDWLVAGLGVVLWAAMLYLHGPLIGTPIGF